MIFDDLPTNDLYDYVYSADSAVGLFREGILTKEELDILYNDDIELGDMRIMLIAAAKEINNLDGWLYEEFIGEIDKYDPEEYEDD